MSVSFEEEEEETLRPVKQNLCGALKNSASWKCLLLSVLIVACLVAITWCRLTQVTKIIVNFSVFPITRTRQISPCDEGYFYLPIVMLFVFYVLYLLECFHSQARKQLLQSVPASIVSAQVDAMRSAQPVIWWKAVCYHYVRRSRHVTRYRNGDSYTSTQIFYERVNSQSAGTCFLYSGCGVKDISKKLVDLTRYSRIRVRFSKGFAFVNVEAATEFEEQRSRFFEENERRDDYMEMREGLDLTGVAFRENVIAHRDTKPSSWYTQHSVFWTASVLLMSWPLRFLIEYNTAVVHFKVTKLFGVNYLTPANCNLTSRGSQSADSQELEASIASNCSLVPSYSEALLMESRCSITDSNANIRTGLSHTLSSTSVDSSDRACGCQSSSTRSSLDPSSRSIVHNGYVLYLPAPLINRTPVDPFVNHDVVSDSPPSYEDAMRVSTPLLGVMTPSPLRRSHTERNIPSASRKQHPRWSCHYDMETQL